MVPPIIKCMEMQPIIQCEGCSSIKFCVTDDETLRCAQLPSKLHPLLKCNTLGEDWSCMIEVRTKSTANENDRIHPFAQPGFE